MPNTNEGHSNIFHLCAGEERGYCNLEKNKSISPRFFKAERNTRTQMKERGGKGSEDWPRPLEGEVTAL